MLGVPDVKITVPAAVEGLVDRPQLRAELDRATDAVLVRAPAGYGKTTLVAEWARRSPGTGTAWVTLDRDDDDPQRLWSAVAAAVARCPTVPPTSPLRASGIRPRPERELRAELVAALGRLPGPLRIVLDDVHLLTEPETLHGVETFLRHRPPGVVAVLVGRLEPPVGLHRIRLAGGLRELGTDRLRLSRAETGRLLERSGLRLHPQEVDRLHATTEGWAAGLRLAALGAGDTPDAGGTPARFAGTDRSMAAYLDDEVLAAVPEDAREVLRVSSISDPMPTALAAVLSGRDDAGSVLRGVEHCTGLIAETGGDVAGFRLHPLARTYLTAELHRRGPARVARLHTEAARWWAAQGSPARALDHATRSLDPAVLPALLRRFALRLVLAGDHQPVHRALRAAAPDGTPADPWSALVSALIDVEAGRVDAARADLRRARRAWPAEDTCELAVLRLAAEQTGALPAGAAPGAPAELAGAIPDEPELEALARFGRGAGLLREGDRAAARGELDAALELARRCGFDYLALQCLVLLGALAGVDGDLATMHRRADEAARLASDHGWERTAWSLGATAMLAFTALVQAEPAEAERLAAEGLAFGGERTPPALRFGLRAVRGAARADRGDPARGLAELQEARAELGEGDLGRPQAAAAALLEGATAARLGHPAAARTVQGWLAGRAGDVAEVHLLRSWTAAAAGRNEQARAAVQPVLDGTSSPVLGHTRVEAWLQEATLAAGAGERYPAHRALQAALAVAEPIGALRPFAQAGPAVRDLLAPRHGALEVAGTFAGRALVAGNRRLPPSRSTLSERERVVLGLLPSLLSLDEIAADLSVSINTVKSHVRSIYSKLGVSSRRTAVLAAYESGLLGGMVRSD
jgi:LuxR family maltose regulon positive regulatory protein